MDKETTPDKIKARLKDWVGLPPATRRPTAKAPGQNPTRRPKAASPRQKRRD